MKLSYQHAKALLEIKNGCDVWDYTLARQLREIEKERPQYLQIGKPQMFQGSGAERMPYFGAIATLIGHKVAASVVAETPPFEVSKVFDMPSGARLTMLNNDRLWAFSHEMADGRIITEEYYETDLKRTAALIDYLVAMALTPSVLAMNQIEKKAD